MSVERVGISKKSENHIQKKSTPFLWTSFQGVGKSPPGWDFPPHFTAITISITQNIPQHC